DSGINEVDDLQSVDGNDRVVYKQSFVPNAWDADDHYGHGTHVAGILGGNGMDSMGRLSTYQIRGIAPAVNFVSLRVHDSTGAGSDSSVIAAIQTAIILKSRFNIRVMNLSLGR